MTNARAVVRLVLILFLTVLLGYGLLYAYRSSSPQQPASPVIGVAGLLVVVLVVVLVVAIIVAVARAMSGAKTGDRYEALSKLADLRDRGVVSEDEFEREKRRILG